MYNPMDCGQETTSIFEEILAEQTQQENVVIFSHEKFMALLCNDHSTMEGAIQELR